MKLKQNVGGWDRNVRFAVAGALLGAGALGKLPLPWRIAMLAVGASELFSASTQYCPISQALGINTNRNSEHEALPEPQPAPEEMVS